MLVTECRHCGARFRATPDQLNQRQGQVRCGQCQRIFNAFESVVRVPLETGQALPQATSVPSVPASLMGDASQPKAVDGAVGTIQATERPETMAQILHRQEASSVAPPTVAQRPARLPRAWSLGVVLLMLVLAAQIAYAYRAQLAHSYPPLRPVLEAACANIGCRIPWMNNEAALKLEDSEMLEVPGKPGQIALQARIRNLSSSAQEFPHLELTLTDLTGQAAIRRVLRPADYLGGGPESSAVMAAGSEALLSVRLETGRIRATGYELLLFYP